VKVEGFIPPMLKPRPNLPLEKDIEVGIKMDGMSIGILGILTDGRDDTSNIPQIKSHVKKCMDSVGSIE
jgi:hypothetical protein